MIVRVQEGAGGSPTASLHDPDDVGRFHVEVQAQDGGRPWSADELDAALRAAGVGRMGDDGLHAYVGAEVLRGLAQAAGISPQWRARSDGMLAYAATKG